MRDTFSKIWLPRARGFRLTRHRHVHGLLVREICLARAEPVDEPSHSETKLRIGDPMNEWLKPHIEESEAGMEVTSYLPAELDRA